MKSHRPTSRSWSLRPSARHRHLAYGLLLVLLTGCAQMGMLRPEPIPPEVQAGGKLLQAGDIAKATAQFESLLQKRPADAQAYALVAAACSSTGHFDLSVRYAERGQVATPKAPAADRANLFSAAGDAYGKLGYVDKEIHAFQEANRLAPNNPAVMNNLGYAYAEMPPGTADLNQALKLTTDAVALARDQGASESVVGTFLDSVGWIQYKMRSYDDALSTLGRAAEMVSQGEGVSKDQAVVFYHLAMAYNAKGQLPAAYAVNIRALQFDKNLSDALTLKRELEEKLPPDQRPGAPTKEAGPIR